MKCDVTKNSRINAQCSKISTSADLSTTFVLFQEETRLTAFNGIPLRYYGGSWSSGG